MQTVLKKTRFHAFISAIALPGLLFLACGGGGGAGDAASPGEPELSDRTFTLGVWMQGSDKTLNGKTIAQNYKDIGINTYVGLWKWPTEDWAYPGYSVAIAKTLKDAGIKAYAGNDAAAVSWHEEHPEYDDVIVGYLLGDEPDMKRNSGVPEEAAANTPLAWHAAGDALLSLDSTRPVQANFGKPFAKDLWYGTENGSTGSKASDFGHYVAPTTIISSDYYGITDPWEPPENHGIWTYGRAVRNTRKYAASRPVWGVVEASAPWKDATSDRWMFQRMPPSLIMPIVWNMVVNGAQGVVYFCHDFSPGPSNKGAYAALLEPGMPEAMKAANEAVMAFGAVLKSPSLPGTTTATDGSVEVVALTKRFNGDTYIFAMADGNANYREGKAVDAEIQVSGTPTGSVEVLNDSRTITMTMGKFRDHFEPYELHIYRF